MKRLSRLIFVALILMSLIWGIAVPSSYSQSNYFNTYSQKSIEANVCPGEETYVPLTITVWADPAQNVYIELIPGADWIIPEYYSFQVQATPEGYTFDTKITLSARDLTSGTYNSTLTVRYNFLASETTKEDIIPVTLHVVPPYFDVNPESLTVLIKPTDEKMVSLSIRDLSGCGETISVSSLDSYENVVVTFNATIVLNPGEVIQFPIYIKTNNLNETVVFHVQFSSNSITKIVTLKICPTISITVSGEIVEVNEKEGYITIETFDGKKFKVILRDEDKGKYKKGDYIKVTGTTGESDDEIIPEKIEEVICGVTISDPEDITFCPTCPEIKYGEEEIPRENVKRIKINAKNTGNINVTVSGTLKLKRKVVEDEKVEVNFEPESFSLKPGEEREITITAMVKKSSNSGAYFYYELNFNISPSPPCNEKGIVKEFKITLCPTIRHVFGSVKFLNPKNKECPLKRIKVLLFLNYEPKCDVYESFKKIEGDFPGVHTSFNTGLPNKKYYIETHTDKDGKFDFLFYDFDCKHDYILAVIFETDEFKVNYYDCKNPFFTKVNIEDNSKPCLFILNKRDIVIGKDGDLTFPTNFADDPRAVAQIFCHIDEAFSVFRNETCDGEDMIKKPLTVCAYSREGGTWYFDKKINIDKRGSSINSIDRPINREWHEFGHFLQDSLYGIPRRAAGDRNHFGFSNSNSTDSFIEGFAEATSLFILRQMKSRGTCCSDISSIRNGIYGWAGGMSDLENGKYKSDTAVYAYFDSSGNAKKVDRSKVKCEGGKLVYKDSAGNKQDVIMYNSDEEFGVAGLILDLLDSGSWYDEIKNKVYIHGKDDDGFSFSNWRDFFCLLKKKEVKNVKELYEALREKFKGNTNVLDKIDKIFIEHGFFQDKDSDGVRDINEKIGVTYRCKIRYYYSEENPNPPPDYIWKHKDIPKIEEREDFPLIPQANILVHLTDKDGNPVDAAILVVDILSFDGRVNFSYERMARDEELFYIFLTPDGGEIMRIHMKGSKERPLIVTEDELWTSVINNNKHVKEHTFTVKEEEIPPEIMLTKEVPDFASLLEGKRKEISIPFVNSGGGTLSVSISTSRSWIDVEPETFEGNAGYIKISVNTEGLSGGVHEGKVILSYNGEKKEIRIKVNVIPRIEKKVIELFIGDATAYINGEIYTLDAAPYIKPPGRTMVPLRFISEGLGATVDYWPKGGKVKEVYIYFKDKKITLFIGKNEALIDNEKVYLDAPPEIKPPGRTFVPIRFIAEAFGADVGWESVLRKVTITMEE